MYSVLRRTYQGMDFRCNVASEQADQGLDSCFLLLMAVGLYNFAVAFEYHLHK